MLHKREIKSYVIREGRMTRGQSRALEEYWPSFGLEVDDGRIDPNVLSSNSGKLVLEIGFGMGDSLFEMARDQPDQYFIGVEVHRPGVGHLLQLAAKEGLRNLKVYRADSIDVLKYCLPSESLDRIQIFFPDPWPKKKHHKRRLLNPGFVELMASKLVSGGILHVATDWTPYAEVIQEMMNGWLPCTPPVRVLTKYEKRGIRLNHQVTDLAYRKR